MLDLIADGFSVLAVVSTCVGLATDRVLPWGPRDYVIVRAFLVMDVGLAVWNVALGDVFQAVCWAAAAGLTAYRLWKHRRPRQRRPEKAAGRVRDLGHRLVVEH